MSSEFGVWSTRASREATQRSSELGIMSRNQLVS